MSDGWKIALVIGAIVLLGIPLAGRLVREDKAGQNVAAQASAQDMTPAAAAPEKTPAGGPRTAPAPKRANAALDANTLVGTTWTMNIDGVGKVTADLLAGGKASASVAGLPMTIEGTWQVIGDQININAAGQAITAQIVGNQVMVNGQPAQRLQ